jgi:glucosamine--fructose-6-phosphate aminotransferase (isomerizing)
LQIDLVAAGHAAAIVECSELVHHQPGWLAADTLVVAASQSGASAEIVRLLELNAGRAAIVGVTNTPGSPLDAGASVSVRVAAGAEATVSCKSYVATLVALHRVSCGLRRSDAWSREADEMAALLGPMKHYLDGWREHVAELCPVLDRAKALFYLGRGRSLATALTAGLITKEATGCLAEGMSCAAFRHGPLELLGPDLQAVVFAGGDSSRALNRRMHDEIAATGAAVFWCDTEQASPAFRLPAVAEAWRPVVEILPVQMMTLALAALGGREAGRFTRATKVTRSE